MDALHDDDFLGRVLPQDQRVVDQRTAQPVAPQLAGIGRLAHEVQFVVDDLFVFGHHLPGAQPAAVLRVFGRDTGQCVQQGDIAVHLRGDARAPHLDHHVHAGRAIGALEPGSVHLRNGRRGQRALVEGFEHLPDGPAQAAFDHIAGLGPGEGRHTVLQQPQFGSDLGRQDVGAGGQRLSELDEHRTQLFQRRAQAHADGLVKALARGLAQGLGQALTTVDTPDLEHPAQLSGVDHAGIVAAPEGPQQRSAGNIAMLHCSIS